VWGSVCLICQPASRSFLLNSPSTCALAPSMTMTLGNSSLWNSKDKSSCASFYFFNGNSLTKPKSVQNICASLFFCLERIVENIVSVYIVTGKRRYLS
jgi:hypothetical protein